jgi:hypothetical protein
MSAPRCSNLDYDRQNAAKRLRRLQILEKQPMSDQNVELEAAAFRRLLEHLNRRNDVQNLDLMILAGFCRNCLADWYREAAEARGIDIDQDTARERIYGEPFRSWKARHQKEATAEQLAAFQAAKKKHAP